MDLLTIGFFCVLEVALLLLVAVAFLKRKMLHMQRRIRTLEQADEPVDAFTSIASGYLPYLEKQIIDTRSRLELSATETGDDGLATALAHRLDALEREKKVTELCNDYPKRRWEHVNECFQPPPAGDEEQVEETPDAPAAEAAETQVADESVARLGDILDQQGSALQSFRQVFEVIKKEPNPQALEQMEKELRELERRYREASTCIEIMEQENARLQDKVEQGKRRLDSAQTEKHESIADLQDQVGKQKRSISDLNHLIDDLQLEAEKAAELQAKLDQFDLATREMNMCIQIMEEENEFLREQVQALVQLDKDQEANAIREQQQQTIQQLEGDLESLRAGLKEKDDRIAALSNDYASLESQYLALYEQTQ